MLDRVARDVLPHQPQCQRDASCGQQPRARLLMPQHEQWPGKQHRDRDDEQSARRAGGWQEARQFQPLAGDGEQQEVDPPWHRVRQRTMDPPDERAAKPGGGTECQCGEMGRRLPEEQQRAADRQDQACQGEERMHNRERQVDQQEKAAEARRQRSEEGPAKSAPGECRGALERNDGTKKTGDHEGAVVARLRRRKRRHPHRQPCQSGQHTRDQRNHAHQHQGPWQRVGHRLELRHRRAQRSKWRRAASVIRAGVQGGSQTSRTLIDVPVGVFAVSTSSTSSLIERHRDVAGQARLTGRCRRCRRSCRGGGAGRGGAARLGRPAWFAGRRSLLRRLSTPVGNGAHGASKPQNGLPCGGSALTACARGSGFVADVPAAAAVRSAAGQLHWFAFGCVASAAWAATNPSVARLAAAIRRDLLLGIRERLFMI